MRSDKVLINTAKKFFERDKRVVLAYAFGSVVKGEAGALSDIDFAVLLADIGDIFATRLKLMEVLAAELKQERTDLVVLNDASLILRYEVVRHGRLLKDNPAARVAFETEVIRDYLDTAFLRDVRRKCMKDQIEKGDYFG